jgi:hypothetical protein
MQQSSASEAVHSRGLSIGAAARPVLGDWAKALQKARRPANNVPKTFFDTYVMQCVIRALFEGGRGGDILLKGATSWSAWSGESGLPLFAAQVAAWAGEGGAEFGLRPLRGGGEAAVSTRPTKDVDFQLSGWADPEEFVAYFKDVVSTEAFRQATGVVVDVDGCVVERRRNVAGVGVAMRGDATVGASRQRWKIEAFVSPFPEPGVGTMEADIAPMMAVVAEKSILDRLLRSGWTKGDATAWAVEPGHLRDKIAALRGRLDEKNADWIQANVVERWGVLLDPIRVTVVRPEYMLAEKLTANWDDGGPLSGLRNVRHKDYWDAETMLRLATDPSFRASFHPPLNRSLVFSPARAQRCFAHCFAARGFGAPPTSVAGLPGLSDAYADQPTQDGQTNAVVYDQAAALFRGRAAIPGRDRPLRQVLPFLREGIEKLGLLPGGAPGPEAALGDPAQPCAVSLPPPTAAEGAAAPAAEPLANLAPAKPMADAAWVFAALDHSAAAIGRLAPDWGPSEAALREACDHAIMAGIALKDTLGPGSDGGKRAARVVAAATVVRRSLERALGGDRDSVKTLLGAAASLSARPPSPSDAAAAQPAPMGRIR